MVENSCPDVKTYVKPSHCLMYLFIDALGNRNYNLDDGYHVDFSSGHQALAFDGHRVNFFGLQHSHLRRKFYGIFQNEVEFDPSYQIFVHMPYKKIEI